MQQRQPSQPSLYLAGPGTAEGDHQLNVLTIVVLQFHAAVALHEHFVAVETDGKGSPAPMSGPLFFASRRGLRRNCQVGPLARETL